MKKVYPIESRCINCHLCEVACIIEHSESKTAMGAYHVEGLRFNLLDGGDITDPAVALVEGLPGVEALVVDDQGGVHATRGLADEVVVRHPPRR